MPDLDLNWMYEAIDEHYEKSNKAELTKDELMNTLFEEGVLAVYNLGMKHMWEYLEDKK